MMYCSKCKTEESDTSKFCGLCGAALESGSHPSNNSPGGATDNDPPPDGFLKTLLAENDIGSLVPWFCLISIFDIGLTYIYSHYNYISLYFTISHYYYITSLQSIRRYSTYLFSTWGTRRKYS